MIINVKDTFIKAKSVQSIIIYDEPKKEIVTPAGWFTKAVTKENPYFSLKMQYKNESGDEYITSWGCGDKTILVTLKEEIVKQIKAQENDYVDRELENAIIGGGNDDGSTS